jgi:bifunctional non-homologous end joining protein LigD
MEYGTFSGSIPEGEYGGGVVRIFDHGTYEMTGRSDDRITFSLEGERLTGTWHLVKVDFKDGKENWLAIMSEDRRAHGDDPPAPDPMLATLAKEAFDDPDWAYEPKWDGVRAIAVCGEDTRLISRNNHDISVAYPELSGLNNQVVALDAMLDGEIVAFEDGVPSFQKLQQRMHLRDPRRIEEMVKRIPVVYMVFDLLFIDGTDMTSATYDERRRVLEEAVVPSDRLQISPAVDGEGVALFEAAGQQGLEGVMAKRKASTYQPGGRSPDWLKFKVVFDADVVIVGWTEGEGNRSGSLGSLVMSVYRDGDLVYVGNVGTGFNKGSLEETMKLLGDMDETEPAFPAEVIRSTPELRWVHWVAPSLVAMVEHRQLTSAGRLRAPAFKGFRDDKTPEQCTYDQLIPTGAR